MRIFRLLLLPLLCGAQSPPDAASGPPVVRGVLLERDPQCAAGEFSVRGADNQVFRYKFDAKTYVERESQLIDVARLHLGEKVEVVSDSLPGLFLRYARTIQVIEDPPPAPALAMARRHPYRSAPERPIPFLNPAYFGNLTYAGVVFRLNDKQLVLHTRDGDRTILLREDTRYLENGGLVGAAALKPNMRVFVRAGKDLYNQVEAYQVIWGGILEPR